MFAKPLFNRYYEADTGTNGGSNAENTSGATENTTEQEGVNNKSSVDGNSKKQTDHMIPKTRFDEVNNRYKDVQAKLDQLLAEKAQSEKQAKEEQGKFQELYQATNEELSTFKSQYEQTESRAKELENVVTTLLNTRLSAIPEDLHDIIPDNLSAEQKLAWIDRAESKGLFGKQKDEPIGEGTNPSTAQATDLNTLSPHQLLSAGYGKK